MDNEKLKDNSIFNETKWPEIFGLTENEVLEIREAYHTYRHQGHTSLSYMDWSKMYNGIYRESTDSAGLRMWLACVRWMRSTTPAPLSEQKQEAETVEQWYAAADSGNSITIYKKGEDLDDEMVCEIISNFEYSTSEQWAHAKRIEKLPELEWQSQHTAKQIDQYKARIDELEAELTTYKTMTRSLAKGK